MLEYLAYKYADRMGVISFAAYLKINTLLIGCVSSVDLAHILT